MDFVVEVVPVALMDKVVLKVPVVVEKVELLLEQAQ
jgi:hypothetical protein